MRRSRAQSRLKVRRALRAAREKRKEKEQDSRNRIPERNKKHKVLGKVPSKVPTRKKASETDHRPKIEVGIERGNRMFVRWPTSLTSLTEQLTYDQSNLSGNLLGRVEELKDGVSKKLTPLNYFNARQVLGFIRIYGQIKVTGTDQPLYNIIISDEFITWFKAEKKAKNTAREAYKLLDYDENIQTKFPFLKIPLYPWQSAAMSFLNAATRHGKGAFLADETGLGKTYEALAHLKSQGLQAVVVCPSGLKIGWKRKTEHLTDLSVLIVGSKYPVDADKYDVIIVSYAMLKKRGPWPLSHIIETQQRVLIMDEGHLSKNYKATRTSMALMLAQYARHTIVVTATPLKNRIFELHPLLRATRRLWTECSQKDFIKQYDTSEGRKDVAEHLQGIMCRRMIPDVWTDPPEGEIGEAWVKLSNKADYEAAEKDFIQWLIQKGFSDERVAAAERGRALVKLIKLRQLAALGKIDAASNIIGKILDSGEQVVAFCSHNEPLFQLAQKFATKTGKNYKGQTWVGSAIIIGETPMPKRMKIIDKFNQGKIGLLCLGSVAGGLGIDLPIARYGYFLDLPWTAADIEQCTGRLLRLGQERDCQFIKCLAAGTIDHRMEEIIIRKATLFKEAIGDEDAVKRVTASDSMKESIVSALIQSYLKDALLMA